MPYAFKIALRYMTSARLQTALLSLGVATGVFIFIFMSALIGGLAEFILTRTVGDISHVTIRADNPDPPLLILREGHVLTAIERNRARTAVLSQATSFLPLIEAQPGVVAVSPQVTGAGFLSRGAQVAQVSITGVEPGRESAILDLQGYMVQGAANVGSGLIVLGRKLSDDLSLRLGQSVRLQSSAGVASVLTVGGIFETGNGMIDGAAIFVSLPTARTLYRMPQGVTRIEIKLADLNAAESAALRLRSLTGLYAVPWTEDAGYLLEALDAQAQTGLVLKALALTSVIVGIASAMLLSTYRRRAEIGIMRAMGAGRGFVMLVFLAQGALSGLLGGVTGAVLGYLALLPFPGRDEFRPGTLPLDITQGAYGLAISLTVAGAIVASILPALAAARTDPVTAINQ